MIAVHGPRVVAIGGGHGLAMSLRAIRTYASHLTAVVATGDDGGSSGRIRADLDIPAPGDLRRCLSALATDEAVAAGFEHRFGNGELAGHAVGNLVLAGLVDSGHDLATAADMASRWLGIDPNVIRVLPATQTPVTVVSVGRDGPVRGQVAVEESGAVGRVSFDPPDPDVADEVISAIEAADQIVLGPGSFATSVLGAAAVPAVAKAVGAAVAQIVLVANLDTSAHDQVASLLDHGIVPAVIVVQIAGGRCDFTDVDVVEADIVRPHGLAHDPDLLGPVLASAFSTK